MKRLVQQSNLNNSEAYDKIFFDRRAKGLNWADERRWKTLLKYFAGGSLMDLGTLDSLVPIYAHQKDPSAHIWALDQAEKAIEEMQKKYPEINYIVGDLYETEFEPEVFDYVVLGEVLEHLSAPELAIAEAVRILKPGGTLAISVPLGEKSGEVDADRHLWSWDKDDMRKMLAPFGSVTGQILRSKWFPRYRYCHPQLITYLHKKYL